MKNNIGGKKLDTQSILEEALNLRPAEKIYIIECLAQSLDRPDEKIDKIWREESEKRYQALKKGKIKTIPLDKIIKRYK